MLEKLFRLDNKVIVITGATGLLGIHHAEAVACYGGTPILLDLNQESLDNLTIRLNKKYNTNAEGFVVDITDEVSIKKNAELLIHKYKKIDGLVNNAANNPKVENNNELNFSRLENFPISQWSDDLNVSLTGSYLCSKIYGYEISKNSLGGSIVNISSDLGLIAPDQRLYRSIDTEESKQSVKPVTYSVVKNGLIGLTRYMSTYWADKGVRSNVMCPGGVENGQSKDFLDRVSNKIPMGRLAKPNEYQGTLIWMLSDASSYLNGAIIPVDGGRTAW
jgi:NAD(P)-dependent dehydrogenase (short-subunit alcohol dehydrogenase family)